MPTYDYKCVKCEHKFERFHGMNETPKITCPVCGAKTEKLIGAGIGIIFKGSGFYETDYKRKDRGGNGKKYKSTGNNGKDKKTEKPESKDTKEVKTESSKPSVEAKTDKK